MRKTIAIIALLIAMCFVLTSCGGFTSWGDEEVKQIDKIDKHTDVNGVVYMDIYYVDEETPVSIALPSGADGTSISFSAKYDEDNRNTVITVSFSNGSPDQTFKVNDGQSIDNVTIVEEMGFEYLYFWCDGKAVSNISLDDIKGKDGATWLTGTEAPTDSVGKNGDFFLDTSKFDVYIKKQDVWGTVGNLTGVGIDKIEPFDGGNGMKITYTDPTWEPTIVLCPGITAINLKFSDDEKQFVFEVTLSNGIVDENGVVQTYIKEFPIDRFPRWDSGDTLPGENDGIEGDFYFFEPSQTILQKKDSDWITIISFSELLNKENEMVTITFNARGGEMKIPGFTNPTSSFTVEIAKGSFVNASQIPIPTKEGYTFGGWYTVSVPNLLINGMFTDMVPVSENITLYAHWIAVDP